jgi:hypothetical protein
MGEVEEARGKIKVRYKRKFEGKKIKYAYAKEVIGVALGWVTVILFSKRCGGGEWAEEHGQREAFAENWDEDRITAS